MDNLDNQMAELEKSKARQAHKLEVEEYLELGLFSKLNELGYTSQSGWGCDCPGGDDVIAVVLRRDSSGADNCLWAWAIPIDPSN